MYTINPHICVDAHHQPSTISTPSWFQESKDDPTEDEEALPELEPSSPPVGAKKVHFDQEPWQMATPWTPDHP